MPTDFIFLFMIRVVVFFYDPSLSESNFISFLLFYSIRVGPSRSELIRSDFCTCLSQIVFINASPFEIPRTFFFVENIDLIIA